MKPRRVALGVTLWCTALAGSLPAQTALRTSPAAAPDTGVAPAALLRAGSLADNLQDDIAASRWELAQEKLFALQRLQPVLDSLEETLEARGVLTDRDAGPELSACLGTLADRLESHRRLPAQGSANAVGRALLPLLAAFAPPARVALARLDVAGRDLDYAAERGSWDAARDALKEIRGAYATVQPDVVRQAPDLDATIQRRLSNLAGALDAHQHVRAHSLAGEFLEDVDLIQSTHAVDR